MEKSIINCLSGCNALCCKDQNLSFPFSDKEAKTLLDAGTIMEKINSSIGPLYKMIKCGFLQGNVCLIHDSPLQPKCCKAVKPGSLTCLSCRKRNGKN